MRKASGFTLIELVIVIVILGILGAVAAPKFINLQGDAYRANVKALAGSVQSAVTLANTKAILNGYDDTAATDVDSTDNFKESTNVANPDLVKFVYGFPAASEDQDGIIAMLQDAKTFATTKADGINYIIAKEGTDSLRIYPANRETAGKESDVDKQCAVIYTEASQGNAPVVVANVKGC